MRIFKRDRATANKLVEKLVDLSFESGRLFETGRKFPKESRYTINQRERLREQVVEELTSGWEKSVRVEETVSGSGEDDYDDPRCDYSD